MTPTPCRPRSADYVWGMGDEMSWTRERQCDVAAANGGASGWMCGNNGFQGWLYLIYPFVVYIYGLYMCVCIYIRYNFTC